MVADELINPTRPSAPRWRYYAIAVALVAVTLLIRLGIRPWDGGQPLLILFALTAVAGLTWLLVQTPPERAWERTAASAIIGGAIGNLYDRIMYGSVVDFLDVYVGDWHWPAFNVADSAITVGVAILLIASVWRTDDVPPPSTDQERFDGEQRAAA